MSERKTCGYAALVCLSTAIFGIYWIFYLQPNGHHRELADAPQIQQENPGFSPDQLKQAERAIDRFLVEEAERQLPPEMRRYYNQAIINDDPAHYDDPLTSAHIYLETGKVCAKSSALRQDLAILRHEAMHGWWQALSEADRQRWLSINGKPLTVYGAEKGSVEEVCDWGREAQKLVCGETSALYKLPRYEFHNPDSPYRRKLDFLYETGGITYQEYRAVLNR